MNAPGRGRAFSAGVAWFLGIMLVVVGAVVTMQGAVILGVAAVVAGLAAVAWAAVATHELISPVGATRCWNGARPRLVSQRAQTCSGSGGMIGLSPFLACT